MIVQVQAELNPLVECDLWLSEFKSMSLNAMRISQRCTEMKNVWGCRAEGYAAYELSPRREECDIWLPRRRRSPLGSEAWPRLRLLAIKYKPSCQFFFEQRFSLLCTTSVSPPIFLKRHRGYRRPALVTGYPFLLTGNQSKKITHHDALLPEEDIRFGRTPCPNRKSSHCEKGQEELRTRDHPNHTTVFVLGTTKFSSYHSRYVRWNNGRTSNPQIDFRMKTNFSRGRMKCRDSNHPWAKSKTTGVILIGRWRVMDRYTSP